MCYSSPVKLPVGCSAIPSRFVDDDSAVVFHVEPVGIGAACAATPQVNVVGVIDAQITVSLHDGVSPRVGRSIYSCLRLLLFALGRLFSANNSGFFDDWHFGLLMGYEEDVLQKWKRLPLPPPVN